MLHLAYPSCDFLKTLLIEQEELAPGLVVFKWLTWRV